MSEGLADALKRVGQGERAAFEEVYRRTSAKLFGVCLRILPREEAEEALQEAFVSVWRRAKEFDFERGRPMTWLITIARNRAVDRLRRTRPIASEPIEAAAPVADPAPLADDLLALRHENERVALCIGALNAFDAQLIRTAFFEDSTYVELAQRVAMPLGTIKSKIRRALLALRECLQ